MIAKVCGLGHGVLGHHHHRRLHHQPGPGGGQRRLTINEDGSIILADPGVLANDSDDVGPMTVKLPIAVADLPAHGTLTQNAAGGFTYIPDANYNGADSFKYRATEAASTTRTWPRSVWTMIAVQDAPTDIALAPSSVAENQASATTVGTFSTTDVDLPSDSHNYTFAGGVDDASFTIDNTAKTLKTAAVFDFETKSSYSISVTSTDSGANAVDQARSRSPSPTSTRRPPAPRRRRPRLPRTRRSPSPAAMPSRWPIRTPATSRSR